MSEVPREIFYMEDRDFCHFQKNKKRTLVSYHCRWGEFECGALSLPCGVLTLPKFQCGQRSLDLFRKLRLLCIFLIVCYLLLDILLGCPTQEIGFHGPKKEVGQRKSQGRAILSLGLGLTNLFLGTWTDQSHSYRPEPRVIRQSIPRT